MEGKRERARKRVDSVENTAKEICYEFTSGGFISSCWRRFLFVVTWKRRSAMFRCSNESQWYPHTLAHHAHTPACTPADLAGPDVYMEVCRRRCRRMLMMQQTGACLIDTSVLICGTPSLIHLHKCVCSAMHAWMRGCIFTDGCSWIECMYTYDALDYALAKALECSFEFILNAVSEQTLQILINWPFPVYFQHTYRIYSQGRYMKGKARGNYNHSPRVHHFYECLVKLDEKKTCIHLENLMSHKIVM